MERCVASRLLGGGAAFFPLASHLLPLWAAGQGLTTILSCSIVVFANVSVGSKMRCFERISPANIEIQLPPLLRDEQKIPRIALHAVQAI